MALEGDACHCYGRDIYTSLEGLKFIEFERLVMIPRCVYFYPYLVLIAYLTSR